MFTQVFSLAENNSIVVDLKATNSVHIFLCCKNYVFFIHAYSSDGKSISQLEMATIYGEKVIPTSNGIILTIPLNTWLSGTIIVSYTQYFPSISYK